MFLLPEHLHPSYYTMGVVMCLTGSTITNGGLVLQKRSFLIERSASKDSSRSQHSRKSSDTAASSTAAVEPLLTEKEKNSFSALWYFGLFLYVAGQALGALSLGFAPQSIISSLGPFSLVSNSVLAPLILDEVFTWRHSVSSALILCGSVVVVLCRPLGKNHDEMSLARVTALMFDPPFLVLSAFYILLGVWVCCPRVDPFLKN